MGYLHIPNLYKDQTILMFRECWALEKIHGTSAHVAWREGRVHLSPGGESMERFAALFDSDALTAWFQLLGHADVVVYGEAYGGSQQGQSWRYGKQLKFIAFDVKIGEAWLSVPNAHDVASKLGMRFVDYERIAVGLEMLNEVRDRPSTQAARNGVEGPQPREGIVLRPIVEMTLNNGERVIAKHKRDDERETKTARKVVDAAELEVLQKADAIAEEWVTPTRLAHVLDKLGACGIERTADVIRAMVEDVVREGAGEILDSKDARRAIGNKARELFHQKVKEIVAP